MTSIIKLIGFGAAVVQRLVKTSIKKNLYWEIKDKVIEETFNGMRMERVPRKVKVYGVDSTKSVRARLIEILMERAMYHKDKFIAPILWEEMRSMEVKKSGKVEHSDKTHDDNVFSYLMALYVWYEGINLSERYGIKKTSIKTDDEVDEQIDYYNDDTVEIVDSFNKEDPLYDQIEQDINYAIAAGGTPLNEFLKQRDAKEKEYMDNLIRTPLGEKAYRQKYGIPDDVPIDHMVNNGSHVNIPDKVFLGFYEPNTEELYNQYNELMNRNVTCVPEQDANLLNDTEYNYHDHFNF